MPIRHIHIYGMCKLSFFFFIKYYFMSFCVYLTGENSVYTLNSQSSIF